MRMRSIVSAALAAGFVAAVVHAAGVSQCPARELGACAKMHLALMRPPAAAIPLVVVAEPMRTAGHG
jgi:hypothetical protein